MKNGNCNSIFKFVLPYVLNSQVNEESTSFKTPPRLALNPGPHARLPKSRRDRIIFVVSKLQNQRSLYLHSGLNHGTGSTLLELECFCSNALRFIHCLNNVWPCRYPCPSARSFCMVYSSPLTDKSQYCACLNCVYMVLTKCLSQKIIKHSPHITTSTWNHVL